MVEKSKQYSLAGDACLKKKITFFLVELLDERSKQNSELFELQVLKKLNTFFTRWSYWMKEASNIQLYLNCMF